MIMYYRKKNHADTATVHLLRLEENCLLRNYIRNAYLPYFGIQRRIRSKRAERNMECMIEDLKD